MSCVHGFDLGNACVSFYSFSTCAISVVHTICWRMQFNNCGISYTHAKRMVAIMNYKEILTANGWVFNRVCSSCGGSKHEWHHPEKRGWICYVWPSLRLFRLVNDKGLKLEESSFQYMNEKLSKYNNELV